MKKEGYAFRNIDKNIYIFSTVKLISLASFVLYSGNFNNILGESLACVASVSVRFRSKERGTRVKDRAKNGASERAGRGWGRNFHFLALI